MKKSVIIVIILSFISSILLVNFFGLKASKALNAPVYVESISIDGIGFVNRGEDYSDKYNKITKLKDVNDPNNSVFLIYFVEGDFDSSEEGLKSNPNRVKVNYTIAPSDSTNKRVLYSYDKNAHVDDFYYDELTQEMVFIKPTTITLIISSLDGTNISSTLKIIIKK